MPNRKNILLRFIVSKQRYFSKGLTPETLKSAPSVAFDQRDNMHITFMQQQYGLNKGDYPLHTVRSSEAFVMLAKTGAACCFVAEFQIESELQSGELIDGLRKLQASSSNVTIHVELVQFH